MAEALFPCPNKSDCAEVAADAIVARNFTSELPDQRRFFAIFYPPLSYPGLPDNENQGNFCSAPSQDAADICSTKPPPPNVLGVDLPPVFENTPQPCTFVCPNGSTTTFTTVAGTFLGTTQQLANALALDFACRAAQAMCVALFQNTEQTCTVTCEDASTQSYTVAAGLFSAADQASANAAALAFACTVAQALCDGTPITIFTNTEQTCTVDCATGTSSYTIPAGVIRGLSQASADNGAMSLACILANLGCSSVPPIFGNTPQTCSQLCNGIPVSYTVGGGVFQALDQGTANAIAFAFACLALSIQCENGTVGTVPPPTAPNLQQTCQVPCLNGGSFTYVVPYNTFRAENQSAANAVAQTAACNLASIYQSCITGFSDAVCSVDAYARSIAVSGALAGAVTGASIASGALPPGVSLVGTTLSGVPVTGGTYTFTVRVDFSGGHFALQPCTITVGEITGTPSAGTVGDAYSFAFGVSGITSPVFSVVGGSLPAGLSLAADGTLSGTPTGAGTSNFVVQAAGSNMTCAKAVSLTVAASSDCPDWDTELVWGTATSAGDDPPFTGWLFAPQGVTNDGWSSNGGVAVALPVEALQWGNTADLNYNGSGCNCNLHLQTSYGFTDPTEVTFSLQVEDLTTATVLLLVPTQDGNDAGIYDFAFSLPDTFGVNHQIRVTIGMTATNAFSGGAANVTSIGTFSNV